MSHNHNRNHHKNHHNHHPTHQKQQVVIIAIPPTTATTVVFPSTADGRAFDSGFYSPGLTNGRASFEEINQFLTEINTLRVANGSQTASGICCRALCFFFTLILFALCMVLVISSIPALTPLVVIGFFVFLVTLIMTLVKRSERAQTEFKAKCQVIVNQHNQNFASRGLRWHLPVYFPRWVELWKDYSVNQGVTGQPIYVPPVNQQPQPYVPVAQNQQNNSYQNYQTQGQTENKNIYTPPSQF